MTITAQQPTLAELATRIAAHHPGNSSAVSHLREQHGNTLPVGDYIAAIQAARAPQPAASLGEILAAEQRANADLAELADIAVLLHPTRPGAAIRALRDAHGGRLPVTRYIRAAGAALRRQPVVQRLDDPAQWPGIAYLATLPR